MSLFWFQETAAELEDEAADEAAEEMEGDAQPLTAPYVTNTLYYRVLPPPPLCTVLLQETAAELEDEAADEAAEEMEGDAQPLSTKDILVRAVVKMGAGIALCVVFSDPLVEALTNLSR